MRTLRIKLLAGLAALTSLSSVPVLGQEAMGTTTARADIAQNLSLAGRSQIFIPLQSNNLTELTKDGSNTSRIVVLDFKNLSLKTPIEGYYEVYLVSDINGVNQGYYVGNLDFFGVSEADSTDRALDVTKFLSEDHPSRFSENAIGVMLRPIGASDISGEVNAALLKSIQDAKPVIGEIAFRAIEQIPSTPTKEPKRANRRDWKSFFQ